MRVLIARNVPTIALVLGLIGLAGETAAQQPSQAQVNAVRQACRGDYMSHCSSVPTGGAAALNCLRQNVASLSPGCQQAVNAIQAPATRPAAAPAATPPAAPPPAAPPAVPAATPEPTAAPPTTTAKAPSAKAKQAATARIRQACGTDYRTHCLGIPPGGQQALACLERNGPTLSPACRQALATVASVAHATPKAAPKAAPPAAAPVAVPVAPPPVVEPAPLLVSPREELFILRRSCGSDYARFCRGLRFGGGRVVSCLHYYQASLSPPCAAALGALREGR